MPVRGGGGLVTLWVEVASDRRTRSGVWSSASRGRPATARLRGGFSAARLATGAVGVAVVCATVLGVPSVGPAVFSTTVVWSAVAGAGANIGSAWSGIVRSGRVRCGDIRSRDVRPGTGRTSNCPASALVAAHLS